MQIDNDIPYLEPLLFHLREDKTLKQYFTEKSFFMPLSNLVSGIEEAMKKNCPAPRALWILPGDTNAKTYKANCKNPGEHSFRVILFVQCIRDQFQLSRIGNEIKLTGQFMELAKIRKALKDSILKFGCKWSVENNNYMFGNVTWMGDEPLYPQDGENFIINSTRYNVTIY